MSLRCSPWLACARCSRRIIGTSASLPVCACARLSSVWSIAKYVRLAARFRIGLRVEAGSFAISFFSRSKLLRQYPVIHYPSTYALQLNVCRYADVMIIKFWNSLPLHSGLFWKDLKTCLFKQAFYSIVYTHLCIVLLSQCVHLICCSTEILNTLCCIVTFILVTYCNCFMLAPLNLLCKDMWC